ncbi:MAG: hypothetical protein H7144_10890 [Burkholderiales bacterium]|nr:hypothetical protein [Phycisphaerae bacterium]
MELEPSSIDFTPLRDPRPFMPALPPVRVIAIDDVRLFAIAGHEVELDAFYVGLLKFERVPADAANPILARRGVSADRIVYRGENALILFEVIEVPPERPDYRPLVLEIPHYADFLEALRVEKIDFERQRGLNPGADIALLRDPSGNWISVAHRRPIM